MYHRFSYPRGEIISNSIRSHSRQQHQRMVPLRRLQNQTPQHQKNHTKNEGKGSRVFFLLDFSSPQEAGDIARERSSTRFPAPARNGAHRQCKPPAS